ncbi:hypothetical protein MmarC5_1289 [Methanococcus maripaludis C5]|uniref:Uncharacterized protein n=1 Tax=Methanococcus maripaludis (strain C5 / ATCC BAA-1333) TaxID=402880 RepID=A4FZF3_METM5|nr:hypothetical protein [Methanococcus maripaludis]ABO35587.1 hypothetical protein MmarC5_1289 [Methanococcus maripaludis C5]
MLPNARSAILDYVNEHSLEFGGALTLVGYSEFEYFKPFIPNPTCGPQNFDLPSYLMNTNTPFKAMDKIFRKDSSKLNIFFDDSDEFLGISNELQELSKKISEYIIPKVQNGLEVNITECLHDWNEEWNIVNVILRTKNKVDPVKKINFLDGLYDEIYERFPDSSFNVKVSIKYE